jgi:hypothetical protein
MKLFTEEQIREALDNEDFAYIANIVIAQMKPIELPNDDEIDAHLEKTHTKAVNPPNVYYRTGFEKGAMWLRHQIKIQTI